MTTAIDTAPVMALRPQDIESLVEELQAYHELYSPLFQRREQRQWSADYLRGLLLVRLSQNSRLSMFNGAKRLRCFQ